MNDADPLTGLPRHESFMSRLSECLTATRAHGRVLSLLGLDIDHLAYINYACGPTAGDAALGAIATILRAVFRADDSLCRFAGNRFYILLPKIGLDEALAIAERLRQAAVPIDLVEPQPHAPRRCLTFSIGVATYPDDGSEISTLLEVVAAGIAQAKLSGRNIVCHASKGADRW